MKILKIRSFVILILLFICTQILSACGINYKIREAENDLVPTIDFVQPWLALNWDMTDWDNLIISLKSQGYEALILQHTAEIESNTITTNYYEGKSSMVSKLLSSALNNNFKIYLGLGDDDLWWDTENYNTTQINQWSTLYKKIIDDLYEYKAAYSETFVGYYFTFEMYTNNSGYENIWATLVNSVINEVNNVDSTMQIVLSPYNSSYYITSKSTQYKLWKNFFENTNLRENDIFAPQDGFGNCSVEYQEDVSIKVYNFLQATYSALIDYSKCKFGVNVEFFTTTSGLYANQDRIQKQLDIANKFADEILSFSYSHYYYN